MSTVKDQPSGKRRWRPWKVLLLTLLCLLALFAGYQWWLRLEMNARLEAAIAATDAIDPNWRWADMVKEYEKLPVSTHFPKAILAWRGYLGWFGDDIGDRPGAILYERYGKHFGVRFPEPYFKILKERLQVPEATGLKNIKEELRLLAMEPSLGKVPFEDNNLMQRARYISNYLLDEVELAIHENRVETLIPLLRLQLRLSHLCMVAPRPGTLMLGMFFRSQGLSGINRALSLGTPISSLLPQIQKIISAEDQSNLLHILQSLRAECFDTLEQVANDPAKRQNFKDVLLSAYIKRSPTLMDRASYWWKWLEVEASLNSLPQAKAEVLESINEAIAVAQKTPEAVVQIEPGTWTTYVPKNLKTVDHLIAKYCVAVSFKVVVAEASYLAELRALIVGVACERYRLATGNWPKDLSELQKEYLPVIPLDPYTGKALLYSKVPDGVVIYSIGIDGVDDGGEVIEVNGRRRDRGVKLLNPGLRGRKYEEFTSEPKQP